LFRKSYCGPIFLAISRNGIEIPGEFAAAGNGALQPWRIGGHADVQVGQLSQHFAILGIQSLGEGGIVELGLALRFA
jgi:hypothetical protein